MSYASTFADTATCLSCGITMHCSAVAGHDQFHRELNAARAKGAQRLCRSCRTVQIAAPRLQCSACRAEGWVS